MSRHRFAALLLILMLPAWSPAAPEPVPAPRTTADLLADMAVMVAAGDDVPESVTLRITRHIAADTTGSADVLLPRVREAEMTEEARAAYVWALGLTGDARAVDTITSVALSAKSGALRHNCHKALAYIGDGRAGAFLMERAEKATGEDERLSLLLLLARMKHAPALDLCGSVLKADPKEFFWQSVFVFGQYGDAAVPFLLEHIADEDANVRHNAVSVLGTWLIAPEAHMALRERYFEEPDAMIRGIIFSGIERTGTDLDDMGVFFEEVVRREEDPRVLRFARETVASLPKWRQEVERRARRGEPDREAFAAEYGKLWESYGKHGDYGAVDANSTPADEAKLKALRERILARYSDESFHDHKAISMTIFWNRLIAARGRR